MYRMIGALSIGVMAALPAQGRDLMSQIAGAWTLTEGAEQMADGSKQIPWGAGELILDPSGHFAFFVFGKDRQKSEGTPDPRVPVGPMVAYHGTFTVDDAAQTVTYHVATASAPAFNGITRTQYVTLSGDTLVTKGSPVKTPQGDITPINEWRREK